MSKESITKLVQSVDRVRDKEEETIRSVFDRTFDHVRFKRDGMAYFKLWADKYFGKVLKKTYKDAVKAGKNNAV